MSEEQHRRLFAVFLAHLVADFDRFVTTGGAEARNLLGYGQTLLHVSADDLATIQDQIQKVLNPYISAGSEGKRRLLLSTVLIPDTTVSDT